MATGLCKPPIYCERFRNSITDYLDQVLPLSDFDSMNEHRIECDECDLFLREIQLTIGALGSLNKGKQVDEMSPELLAAFRRWKRAATEGGDSIELDRLIQLLGLSKRDQRSAIADLKAGSFINLGVLATEEASRLTVRDLNRAASLGELAIEILSEGVRRPQEAGTSLHDCLVRAWSVLANCRKILSDFAGAAEAFVEAEAALRRGSGDPRIRSQFLQIRAQYLADRGRFSASTNDLDEAIEVYRRIGDTHNEGRSLIGKGRVLGTFGRIEEAISVLELGLELIDQSRDLRLVLVGNHNLVQYLCECRRWSDAHSLLPQTRALHDTLSNPVDLIRFQWLEGKIALDLGDLEGAESSFVEAKQYFVEEGMAYDAALVSLDLAMVYMNQARIAELKSLAVEMVTIFRALGIPREVLAALTFFNKALEVEQTATVGLLQELQEILERTRQREDCRPRLGVSN